MRTAAAGILLTVAMGFSAVAAEKIDFGSIHVHAKPGVIVFIDGKPAGITVTGKLAVTIPDVSPGKHTLRMTLLGFRTLPTGSERDRNRVLVRSRGAPSPPMPAGNPGG